MVVSSVLDIETYFLRRYLLDLYNRDREGIITTVKIIYQIIIGMLAYNGGRLRIVEA